MTFSVKEGSFYLNERKIFLNSGEIHYFRIRRDLWDKHLEAARDAGLTAVSTYVPWAWHEPEENVFDFKGTLSPERDLEGWIERCKTHNLNCIVKPGPFILAEFRGAGLPVWFLDSYADEIKMRNRKGGIVRSDGVNLFNRKYLEKVSLWYDRIMPFIAAREITAGGPVIMMQICNEIGVFSWLAHQADYGNSVKERFISYLSDKYKNIEAVNDLWGTTFKDFAHAELPPEGMLPYASKGDRSRDHEWHCFWRKYYGDYLRMLTLMARERGVTVPVYHNLPGWIYGHGFEFPVNITMYEDLFSDNGGILFGVDHIPEFMSHRNMHDDRIINDIALAMQNDKPLFAAELQCGSREYHVVTNPREMELFYKAGISNGLTGWNYYMFSRGRNEPRTGYSGETFYWFTPLTPEGERTGAFPLVSRMSKIAGTLENLIVNASRRAEVCVLFYPPYYATELERPVDEACSLRFVPSEIRRPAFFDGLLKALQILNIDYDMIDLSKARPAELEKYKQVWAFCTDEMNAPDQQKVVDYTRSGGNLILFPYLPDREMSQKDCSIIRDALSVYPSGTENIDSPLVDIFNLKDVKCANPQITYSEESLTGAEIIARTIKGSPCGFIKPLGKGSLIHIGTWIGFETEAHRSVYEAVLRISKARLRQSYSVNENIIVRERFTNERTAMLFIGNYYNEEQEGKVTYTHPENGNPVTIPWAFDEIVWPPLYAVVTPVCLELSEGLNILHCTSDILAISKNAGNIEITLYGDRDLPGEMVFEGIAAKSIRSGVISGNPVRMFRDKNRTAFIYRHEHKKEFVLEIKTT